MMPNRDHDSLQSAKLLLIEFLPFTRLLQIMLQKRSIIFGTCVLGAGVIHTISSLREIQHKEVTLEYRPDALQQNRVDALTLEDVIHVGAVAVQPLRQPRRAVALPPKFGLNFLSDMNHHLCSFSATPPPRGAVLVINVTHYQRVINQSVVNR